MVIVAKLCKPGSPVRLNRKVRYKLLIGSMSADEEEEGEHTG